MKHKIFLVGSIALVALALGVGVMMVDAQGPIGGRRASSAALGAGFTYQGQLKQNGALVNGMCELQVGLWDSLAAGSQLGFTQTVTPTVTNGLFTAALNDTNQFGANPFSGDARWLAFASRCPSGGGSYTNLDPREPVTPAPYALTAMKTAYKNLLVVAKSGGHYNIVSDALNSISDNTASNHYLIYVAPGIYTETVTMKPYVDIEGAGELTTKITQTSNVTSTTGTVVGASNAELRFLTVENTGGNYDAIAIYNSSASPRLTHITATATGITASIYAVNNVSSSSPTMTNVTISASGSNNRAVLGVYGVANNSSSVTINVSSITALGGDYHYGYGVFNYASSGSYIVTVSNSIINGHPAVGNGPYFSTFFATSQLNDTVFANGVNPTCVYVYGTYYNMLNSACN